MNVRKLIEQLSGVNPDLEVKVATSPNKDEWYEIEDIEITPNRGNTVVVINTD